MSFFRKKVKQNVSNDEIMVCENNHSYISLKRWHFKIVIGYNKGLKHNGITNDALTKKEKQELIKVL